MLFPEPSILLVSIARRLGSNLDEILKESGNEDEFALRQASSFIYGRSAQAPHSGAGDITGLSNANKFARIVLNLRRLLTVLGPSQLYCIGASFFNLKVT